MNVILLDWRMPDMNGLEVLCELRRRAIATAVIFLTGFADETLEEVALAAGAADFIPKSRGLSVLGRRIELAAEGRRPNSQPPLFRLGPLKLRFDISRAFWCGLEIDLTLTEFRMVSKLALEAGQEVAYRDLYDLVHGKGFVTGYNGVGHFTNMRTFIKRIRRKFQAVDPSFSCIKTREGYGYCWIGQ